MTKVIKLQKFFLKVHVVGVKVSVFHTNVFSQLLVIECGTTTASL